MGYGTNGLTFNTLRGGNIARLPEFRTKQGELAHSKKDGSDWTPAQWLQAVVGELGEYAALRDAFERGDISLAEYSAKAADELADVQTYLDILASRALDDNREYLNGPQAPAQALQTLVAALGEWANERKKYERGDLTEAEYNTGAVTNMAKVNTRAIVLQMEAFRKKRPHTVDAHPTGVNLGQATMDKFNRVSERVGSRVRLAADDWHYEPVGEE